MLLARRLSQTTLGDILASLYRRRVTGIVELVEVQGPRAGRRHRIHLTEGAVHAVETGESAPPLGEILRGRGLLDEVAHRRLTLRLAQGSTRLSGELLVEDGVLSEHVLDAALRHQLRARLDALFRLPDATITFHVGRLRPRSPSLGRLSARDVLDGRPRARERNRERRPGRARALGVLGLSEEATGADVRRAFRTLASDAHPDRHRDAPEEQRRAMEARFAELSAAYHELLR